MDIRSKLYGPEISDEELSEFKDWNIVIFPGSKEKGIRRDEFERIFCPRNDDKSKTVYVAFNKKNSTLIFDYEGRKIPGFKLRPRGEISWPKTVAAFFDWDDEKMAKFEESLFS